MSPSAASGGTTAALTALMFILLRLLAVARYDWDTAFALADSVDFGDAISLVVGTLLAAATITALLLAVIVPFVIASHLRHLGDPHRSARLTVVLAVLALFLAAVIRHRLWAAFALCALVGLGLYLLHRRGGDARTLANSVTARVGALAVAATLVVAAATDEVWVPKERLTTTGGQVLTGYVMKAEPGFVTFLDDRTRTATSLISSQITSRDEAD